MAVMKMRENKTKHGKGHTFYHYLCQYCIWGLLLMAWCIVKKEQSPEITFEQAFKNVNSRINLHEKFFRAKISIMVPASSEENLSIPKEKSVRGWGKDCNGWTHCHHTTSPTQMLGNPKP